ncbi:MAG: hypothetical protein CSA49_06055, partial [Gammaproteobacteria bacterium]
MMDISLNTKLLPWVLAMMLIPFLIPAQSFADSEWELNKDKKGIKIFTRDVSGSDYKSFRGEATLKTNLSTLMAIHADANHANNWLQDCEQSKLLSEFSPAGYSVYFIMNMPWPVQNRDYALSYTIEQAPDDLTLTLSFTLDADLVPTTDDYIRVTKLNGFWKMT